MYELMRFQLGAANSAVVRLAKSAGVLALLGLIAAETLGALAERGALPRIALVWPQDEARRLAGGPQSAGVTIYRTFGVDGVTTSTIPRLVKTAAAISPCGEAEK